MSIFVYISGDGDKIGRMVSLASMSNSVEDIAKLSQSIESGNEIIKSWVLSRGGVVISIGGDDFKLRVGAEYLTELPLIKQQYVQAVGATLSIGIGTKILEADRALMASKLAGGNKITLYTPEVEDIIAQAKQKTQPVASPTTQTQPENNQAAPQNLFKDNEDKNVQKPAGVPQIGNKPPEPEQDPTKPPPAPHGAKPVGIKPEGLNVPESPGADGSPPSVSTPNNGLKSKVTEVLNGFRQHAEHLEMLRQSDPELYQSLMGMIQSMVGMAEQLFNKPSSPINNSPISNTPQQEHKPSEPPKKEPQQNNLHKDLLPGGLADNANPNKFDKEQLKLGIIHELNEHTGDPRVAAEIAMDHLTENSKYYKKPKKLKKDNNESGLVGQTTQQNQSNLAEPPKKKDQNPAELKTPKIRSLNSIKNKIKTPKKLGGVKEKPGKYANLPVGAQLDSGPSGTRQAGKIKVENKQTGHTGWRSVRAGMTLDAQGNPISSQESGKKINV